jgi:hypothetical protein
MRVTQEVKMSITFRITTAAQNGHDPVATINARQLAAFRTLLRASGTRLGMRLLDPDEDGEVPLAYSFEARVCPLALASMARVFDSDADAIAVLEEAQFRGRRVSFWRDELEAAVKMHVSVTSDLGVELDLANSNAYTLLESLGFEPESIGDAPVDEVRQRLDNPVIQRRMSDHHVAHYAERLKRLLATADLDDSSRFEWA